ALGARDESFARIAGAADVAVEIVGASERFVAVAVFTIEHATVGFGLFAFYTLAASFGATHFTRLFGRPRVHRRVTSIACREFTAVVRSGIACTGVCRCGVARVVRDGRRRGVSSLLAGIGRF